MSMFSYHMKHAMGDFSYRKDLMTRWGVGCIEGSEHKAHGKMVCLFTQPYISSFDYDAVDFHRRRRFCWRRIALSRSISDESIAR
jgi:hypothetical protein